MRIEDLTVALRPRSAWEAVELGTALARRHAGAIWKPWLLLSLPAFVLLNAAAWTIDAIWLAGLAMWWLKPAFDRVPLYVLSRAVFGQVPTAWQTLRAQWSWARRWLPTYLTWRRLGPVRSLYLPVDLLEGSVGEAARARRRALGAPVYGVGALLTVVFANFELALLLGTLGLGMLFVPNEFVQETAARLWNMLEAQPAWLQLLLNAVMWFATSVLEPFYVGAGFGLYLNRRTEIEAWDIEMALRRLRARLAQAAAPLLLVAALGLGMPPAARAQDEPEPLPQCPMTEGAGGGSTLEEVFGDARVDDAGWQQAVKRAYEDPKVSPKRIVSRWVPKDPKEPKPPGRQPPFLEAVGAIFAAIGEYGLWIVVGILVLVLLLTAPKWLRWMRDTVAQERREPAEIRREVAPEAGAPLPDDIAAAARRLWQSGRERDALALLYRGSVEAMTRRAQVTLVPGATEAHTLRASRQLPLAADREAFARTVRTWQLAAYAHGLPTQAEFEDLLAVLSLRFFAAGGAA